MVTPPPPSLRALDRDFSTFRSGRRLHQPSLRFPVRPRAKASRFWRVAPSVQAGPSLHQLAAGVAPRPKVGSHVRRSGDGRRRARDPAPQTVVCGSAGSSTATRAAALLRARATFLQHVRRDGLEVTRRFWIRQTPDLRCVIKVSRMFCGGSPRHSSAGSGGFCAAEKTSS